MLRTEEWGYTAQRARRKIFARVNVMQFQLPIQLIKNNILILIYSILILTGTVLGQCIEWPGNLFKVQILSQLVWGEACILG